MDVLLYYVFMYLCNNFNFSNIYITTVMLLEISIFFFEKKIYFYMRKNQQKNTTNKTMYKRQSKEKTIE